MKPRRIKAQNQEAALLLQRWEEDPAALSVAEYQRVLAALELNGSDSAEEASPGLAALIAADFRRVHGEESLHGFGNRGLDVPGLNRAENRAPEHNRAAIMAQIGAQIGAQVGQPKPFQPRRFQPQHHAPLYAMAAAAALVLALTVVLKPGAPTVAAVDTEASTTAAVGTAVGAEAAAPAALVVRFELVDAHAETVALAGTFTEWSLVPLTPSSDGVWFIELELVPNGAHTYNFVIDNQVWIADPTAQRRVQDDFGGEQSVLFL